MVPAHGEIDYIIEITVYEVGPFSCDINLFVDDGDLKKNPLTVRGVGVATEPNVSIPP